MPFVRQCWAMPDVRGCRNWFYNLHLHAWLMFGFCLSGLFLERSNLVLTAKLCWIPRDVFLGGGGWSRFFILSPTQQWQNTGGNLNQRRRNDAPAMLKPWGREYLFTAVNKNSANSHKMFVPAMLKSFRRLWFKHVRRHLSVFLSC